MQTAVNDISFKTVQPEMMIYAIFSYLLQQDDWFSICEKMAFYNVLAN